MVALSDLSGGRLRNSGASAGLVRTHLLVVGFLAASGCIVGPDYVRPDTSLPDVWHQELVRGLEEGEANLETWWTALGDPLLDSLIERAKQGTLDLRGSIARIHEARAVRGIAVGERFPDTDGTGTAQRIRISEEVIGVLPPPLSTTNTFYGLGVGAFWEIDLWGRITRSIESADANVEASVENYRDVLVSLYAEVATTYVEVRALQARIRFNLGNINTQRESLQLTEDRLMAGLGSDLEVIQAQLNLGRTESFLPPLRSRLAASTHALAVLLGQQPSTLSAELEDLRPVPDPPPRITVGLPAELLRQRPDVRRAERELAAQTARVGVATSQLYPSFSLIGNFSVQSVDRDTVFSSGSSTYNFGPAFRWNLFDGGRVRQAIHVEDARTEYALVRYEQALLRALQDVEDSMVAYAEENERRDALARAVAAARTGVELVNTLYLAGLTDFLNVLDTERSLFEQEDRLAESEGLVTENLIRIYRALGGGWSLATN